MPDFVAGVVARRKKNKTKYLVMWTAPVLKDGTVDYTNRKLKFAGGMEHPAEHGDLEKTLRAELKEETGLEIKPEAEIELLLTHTLEDGHEKNFMFLWRRDCEGSLRKGIAKDGRTFLSAPFFADKEYLEEHLHGDHRLVLPKLE